MNFEKLNWENDRVVIGDFTFSLGISKPENFDKGDECFVLWKNKAILDEYKTYFSINNKQSNNVLELGMWDGGSTALWYELLRPKRIVGIDNLDKKDTDYFTRWKHQRMEEDGSLIKTFWNTSQANAQQVRDIIKNEFNGESIDIVFDDASHHYSSTIVSFETIFPYLQPRAIYIIEDWAWLHWKNWVHKFPRGEDISKLVYQMIQSAGSYSDIISSVNVYPGFAVVERGTKQLSDDFKLQEHIFLPTYNKKKTFKKRLKAAIKAMIE